MFSLSNSVHSDGIFCETAIQFLPLFVNIIYTIRWRVVACTGPLAGTQIDEIVKNMFELHCL